MSSNIRNSFLSVVAGVILGCIILVIASGQRGPMWLLVTLGLASLSAAIVWARSMVGGFRDSRGRRITNLCSVAVVLGSVAISFTSWPFDVRWNFDKEGFERASSAIIRGEMRPDDFNGKMVGSRKLSQVSEIDYPHVILFRFDSGIVGSCSGDGVAIASRRADPRTLDLYPSVEFSRISGDWWRFTTCQ